MTFPFLHWIRFLSHDFSLNHLPNVEYSSSQLRHRGLRWVHLWTDNNTLQSNTHVTVCLVVLPSRLFYWLNRVLPFFLTPEPPVRFKQPLIDLEVWERDLAVLECEVPEDSVPITWYLEDRRLQPGAKYGMEEWGTKRRLTIRDIGVDDDGIYLCEMPDGGRSIAEVAVKGNEEV